LEEEIVRVDEIGEFAAAMASGEWKRRRRIALVANVLTNVLKNWPKIHPKGIKLANRNTADKRMPS
jgi:hypothetical protein